MPRVSCTIFMTKMIILFALFLSLFALDVFGEGYVGAVLFPALGIFFIVWMWGRFPAPSSHS
ncbi:MAG: hypothetical protein OES69_07365 [Myxococcales bacterium]|nr:hypothetical protein [Myxococcales bacterium]MDH3843741.1 hypothetical protein [Myxococcales bacterium]